MPLRRRGGSSSEGDVRLAVRTTRATRSTEAAARGGASSASASASSPTFRYRSSLDFYMHRATTRSNASGTSGRIARSDGTEAWVISTARFARPSDRNGARPATSS